MLIAKLLIFNEMNKPMKVIITGSEGFIGRALSQALQKRGVEVIGIDRKNGKEVIDIAKYMPDDLDIVFHLAAQTSVFNSDMIQIRIDNIDSFMAVVAACAKHPNHPKLVYASSSTANPPNTTSMYGITKHFAEVYARIYLPSATGVRLHNVYGPNPRQGTLLWCLLNQDNVTIYNEGRNVRHFTYISDIVESLIFASGCNRQLINAANPEEISTLHLAQIVSQYKPLEIELVAQKREFDRTEQTVNESVYTVPLQYISVSEGIRDIFRSYQDEQTE